MRNWRTIVGRPGLLVPIVVLVVASCSGGSGDDAKPGGLDPALRATTSAPLTDAPTTTTTSPALATSSSSTTTTEPVPVGPFVRLDEVVDEDGLYRANYTVFNYTPQIGGGPDSLHVHVFLDSTLAENAGTNGSPPGDWNLTDEPSSFLTTYGPANRGAATRLCTVVADVNHGVFDPASGTCVPLPG